MQKSTRGWRYSWPVNQIRALILVLVIWGEMHEPERFQRRLAWLDKQVEDVKKMKGRDSNTVAMLVRHYLHYWDVIAELLDSGRHRGKELTGDIMLAKLACMPQFSGHGVGGLRCRCAL